MLRERTVEVSSLEELGQAFAGEPVFANAPFCERPGCEEAVKAAAHALTVRGAAPRPQRGAGALPGVRRAVVRGGPDRPRILNATERGERAAGFRPERRTLQYV